MENRDYMTGPWRATRLWNDIIRTMRTGMPVKKHKKNMKSYENCFSSVEAIEWLNKTLQKNDNFGPDVSREQTVQLLRKLFRAGIIENVRDEGEDEFKESGELYRMSNKSPIRNIRTPGKRPRPVLGDVANTPRRNKEEGVASEENVRRKRDSSRVRRAREDQVKKQLNLSFFQSLPSNSLIVLDNDQTWLKVFSRQLSDVLSPQHIQLMKERNILDIDLVMYNMTRVSGKGIVQLDDKSEDLPHWVLSAMKCLANWPRQLKTQTGRESCLPNYPGFEQDVFNVVKDYFLGLSEPLTTFSLFEFFISAWMRSEVVVAVPAQTPSQDARCQTHPGSGSRPCTRPFTITGLDTPNQFYKMEDSEDFMLLNNRERVAKIKQTFSVLPPLATSSVKDSSSNSTAFSSGSLSPDMSTTAIMRNFLPPNTCFETAFMESSPVTRIVPQAQSETLHLSRSGSGRSLSHISTTSSIWATKSTSTQTESLKRLPKWKRSSRLRKSIAVMEGPPEGQDNPGFTGQVSPIGQDNPGYTGSPGLIHSLSHSLDNLLDKQDFMSKYRQVSGDLRTEGRQARSRSSGRMRDSSVIESRVKDSSVIESKTVRKEKRKSKYRDISCESGLSPQMQRVRLENRRQHASCYTNPCLDSSDESKLVPEPDISPVPCLVRQGRYNHSYRLANNQPATPGVRALPRSSTLIELSDTSGGEARSNAMSDVEQPRSSALIALSDTDTVHARAEPYINSDMSERDPEPVYTVAGPGPLRRYTAPPRNSFRRSQSTYGYIPPQTQGQTQGRSQFLSSAQIPQQCPQNCPLLAQCPHSQCSQHCPPPSDQYGQHCPPPSDQYGQHCPPPNNHYPQHDHFSQHCPPSNHHYPQHCPPQNEQYLHYCSPPNDQYLHPTQISRNQPNRSSSHSQADSGRSSLPPGSLPTASDMFKLLGLLIPPASRRKLQLLLKFILKISHNQELSLDSKVSNLDLALNTFLEVVLRSPDPSISNPQLSRQIIICFLDNYDQIWTPPQKLRKEVEESVYQGLVNKRLAQGEDPYPVTYCDQVTLNQYEKNKFSGSQAALMDLLETIVKDEKMAEKNKKKKLRKFKESYPEMWKSKFPSSEVEPDLMSSKKDKSNGKLTSLSRLKSAMRM